MKHLIGTAALLYAFASPALSQDDSAFVEFQVLKPEVAQQMAEAALIA